VRHATQHGALSTSVINNYKMLRHLITAHFWLNIGTTNSITNQR